MPFICDTHVHIYPSYPLEDFFRNAFLNLTQIQAQQGLTEAQFALILTERFDCHFFQTAIQSGLVREISKFQIRQSAESDCLIVQDTSQGRELLLFPGRQIVTSERLEMLALVTDADIPDGLPWKEVLERIVNANGVAVLNWAPGKWMFKRRPIVEQILKTVDTSKLCICDTTLRPNLCMEPDLMRKAKLIGFNIIAGSDPLPHPGQHELVGTYGIYSSKEIQMSAPASSMKKLLQTANGDIQRVGKRPNWITTAARLVRHAI